MSFSTGARCTYALHSGFGPLNGGTHGRFVDSRADRGAGGVGASAFRRVRRQLSVQPRWCSSSRAGTRWTGTRALASGRKRASSFPRFAGLGSTARRRLRSIESGATGPNAPGRYPPRRPSQLLQGQSASATRGRGPRLSGSTMVDRGSTMVDRAPVSRVARARTRSR